MSLSLSLSLYGYVCRVIAAVEEDIEDIQVAEMRDSLAKEVVESVRRTVPTALEKTVPYTVPPVLMRYLPLVLIRSLSWSLTHTLTRALTHAIAPSIALSMARPVEEEYVCSQCYYHQWYCDLCSWTTTKTSTMLYVVDRLSSYYSDLFSEHFTGGFNAFTRKRKK